MAHAQKPDFVFRRNGWVHINRQGRQFSRLLAAEVCASAVVMLDTPCSEVVWIVLATHSIRQFPLHVPNPCTTVCHHISTWLYLSILTRLGAEWLGNWCYTPRTVAVNLFERGWNQPLGSPRFLSDLYRGLLPLPLYPDSTRYHQLDSSLGGPQRCSCCLAMDIKTGRMRTT